MNAHIAALRKRLDAPVVPGSNAHLVKLQGELADYFAGSLRRFSVPLSYRGTTFQQRVWEQYLRFPTVRRAPTSSWQSPQETLKPCAR